MWVVQVAGTNLLTHTVTHLQAHHCFQVWVEGWPCVPHGDDFSQNTRNVFYIIYRGPQKNWPLQDFRAYFHLTASFTRSHPDEYWIIQRSLELSLANTFVFPTTTFLKFYQDWDVRLLLEKLLVHSLWHNLGVTTQNHPKELSEMLIYTPPYGFDCNTAHLDGSAAATRVLLGLRISFHHYCSLSQPVRIRRNWTGT